MVNNYDNYIIGGKSHTLSEVISVYKQDEANVSITFRCESQYGFCSNTENLGNSLRSIAIDGTVAKPGDTMIVVMDYKKPNENMDLPYDETKANILAVIPTDGGPVELFPVDNWWRIVGRTKISLTDN